MSQEPSACRPAIQAINEELSVAYEPNPERYARMPYRRCGRSGIKLPAISLGLWHNFGEDRSLGSMRALCRTAFDGGVTHFDLANNYGPPPGAAESSFGKILRSDFAGLRDELLISTKAGYPMWPGPYGQMGSRKYLLASLDQSLKRLGLDYVDIFYSHRFDPDTPLEETMGALDAAVRQGKALYAGISSYNAQRTGEAAAILSRLGTPCLIHQPSYSMLNRWIETTGLLDRLGQEGIGCIAYTPLAQGLLTSKYLGGVPEDSRAAQGKSLRPTMLSEDNLQKVRGLAAIAEKRGQSLAQMALAWVLREQRVSSALIGASRPEQIIECLGALDNLAFSEAELREINEFATDGQVNLWTASAEL
jgi:L-glyceraldehyde 3-phosphate reductase